MIRSPEEILVLFVIIFDMVLFSLWLFNIARGIFKIASNAPVSATNASFELTNLEEGNSV